MIKLLSVQLAKIKSIMSQPTMKLVVVGIIGVVLIFVSVAGLRATSIKWWGTADSPLHLDYVWQLSQGQLPEFDESVQYKPLNDIREHPVQYVSQHPPLFYAIMSPIMKPSLESGEWHFAVAAGRVANILIGVLCVLALAWAGWTIGQNRKHLFAVALPAVGGLYSPLLRVSSDIYNDGLFVLFSILALTLSYKIIQEGPSRRLIGLLSIVSMLGMLSRAAFISVLGISLLSLCVSYIIRAKERSQIVPSLFKGGIASAAVFILVVMASGWFYMRNYLASGSWSRSGSQDWVAHLREYKSFTDVVTDIQLYSALTINPFWQLISSNINLLLHGLIVVVALYWLYLSWRKGVMNWDKSKTTISLLLVLFLLLTMGMQIVHAVGYGQFSARYFLGALLPVSALVTAGLLAWSKLRGILIIGFSLVSVSGLLWTHSEWISDKYTRTSLPIWEQYTTIITQNGAPILVPIVLAGVLLLGVIVLSASIWKLADT